jgi:putative ABC transport system permease protein
MRLLRDLARRKLRTALTISGITIGIWALVVFGSMANKINALVEGGSQYFGDKVVVSGSNMGGFGTAPMSISTADSVAALDGVDVVVPSVTLFWDREVGGGFGLPDQITGSVAGAERGREKFVLRYSQGRGLSIEDEGNNVVVLGADIARKHDAEVGRTMTIRGHEFQIVGILEPTLTAPDTTALVPLEAAQRLFYEDLPELLRQDLTAADLVTQLIVDPDPGVDTDSLATTIEATIPATTAMTGTEFDAQIGSTTAIFNAIIIGVALISLVVGGLSVINTMAMSVAERTREIGIKRAIGGSRRRIVRELVTEAGLIGLIGGLIGLGLGAIVVVLANDAGRDSGTVLFELTTGTAITAVVFSTVLGMLAGIIPATHAARLDPVQALRYE